MLQKKKTAMFSQTLPCVLITVYALLTLLGFSNSKVSAAIFLDKLIWIVAALLPVLFALGAIISIVALFKSKKKSDAVAGLILNFALLITILWFSPSFIAEFKFTILGM